MTTSEIAPGIVEIDTLLGGWEKVTAGYLVHGDAPVLVETGQPELGGGAARRPRRPRREPGRAGRRGGDPHPSRSRRRRGRRGAGLPRRHRVRARERGAPPRRPHPAHRLGVTRVRAPARLALRTSRRRPRAERIHVLADGEEIRVSPDRVLTTVDSPGHAKHHLALHDSVSGVLFAGDAVGVRLPDAGVLRPSTPPPDFDLDLAVHSLHRFAARRPSRPGPGPLRPPRRPRGHPGRGGGDPAALGQRGRTGVARRRRHRGGPRRRLRGRHRRCRRGAPREARHPQRRALQRGRVPALARHPRRERTAIRVAPPEHHRTEPVTDHSGRLRCMRSITTSVDDVVAALEHDGYAVVEGLLPAARAGRGAPRHAPGAHDDAGGAQPLRGRAHQTGLRAVRQDPGLRRARHPSPRARGARPGARPLPAQRAHRHRDRPRRGGPGPAPRRRHLSRCPDPTTSWCSTPCGRSTTSPRPTEPRASSPAATVGPTSNPTRTPPRWRPRCRRDRCCSIWAACGTGAGPTPPTGPGSA